ncbi:hypothetical protein [Mariniplasma anaerobium]|uniref:Uncharacterized protein n=1 Tax=Mariniplasma anaerobium TaxID=2735436 RepID=A0A7U9XUY6_9MOLU|nr:hypothetical protein [Mariniplasma anaerobium]BCR35155.1 hypothetical protein MPAN_000480 [Mariniplasma anaerobium]
MKFLFKIIVIPILSIIAIPLIMAALLYKSVEIPVDDFTSDGNTVLIADMINEEVDTFLESNDTDSAIELGISQNEANLMLKETFLGMNPNYLVDSATDDEKNYVMKEPMYGYQGSWVRFEESKVEIESGIHLFMSGITFKTRLLITFELEANTDEIVLTLDKLTIGNLPLAWAFGAADWAVSTITGNDLEEMINGQLNGMAEFDPTKREIRVDVQTLVDSQIENSEQAALINSLMAFVDENELLEIGFNDGSFDASLALGKTKDSDPAFELTPAQKITTDQQLQDILESKATSILLSSLTTDTDPYIEFRELTLNRVLDYMLKDQQQAPGILIESPLLEDYTMTAYVPYITMTDNLFVVNIPLKIVSILEPTHSFQTIIKIDALPTIVTTTEGTDLVIVLNELTAGEVTLTEEHVGNVLTMLGDTDLINEDGNLVIRNFDEQMSQAGMTINAVAMVNNKLRLYVGLGDTILLGDLQDTISDVLDGLSGDTDLPPEIVDSVDDIIASLSDPAGDPEQAVEAFMDTLEGLDDAEQEEVFDALLLELEDSSLTLEDILGLTLP